MEGLENNTLGVADTIHIASWRDCAEERALAYRRDMLCNGNGLMFCGSVLMEMYLRGRYGSSEDGGTAAKRQVWRFAISNESDRMEDQYCTRSMMQVRKWTTVMMQER
jgi:hypothetical protein